MKTAIEAARRREQRTAALATEARHARERYDLYKARTYGPTLTSFSRLRELECARDLAEERLKRAQRTPAENRHEPDLGESFSEQDLGESLSEPEPGPPGGDPRLD